MTKSRPPTLEDVAKAAGVSTATISRSITRPGKVAKATQDRIQQAIDDLGYTPNFGGRVLASSRTNTVGAVIPSMSNAMFANGLQAFQETLAEAGVTMLVASTGYDPDNELSQIRSLLTHGADGLLLIGAERPTATQDFLQKRKVPYVVSWFHKNDSAHLYAGFDNAKGAREITRAVLDQGHRDIAMIGGISAGNDRVSARIAGVQQEIATYGDGARLLQTVESRYEIDAATEAMGVILESGKRPTAVICTSDVLAAGAMIQARRHGLQIPRDLSITGYDDIGIARVVDPPLTTVHIPQTRMGQAAARLLLDRLAGSADLRSIEIETSVIRRGSLAPPRMDRP